MRGPGRKVKNHGQSGTPEYASWMMMWTRCTNPKTERWQHYGGKGVKVCKRWESFVSFREDMGPRPPGTSIDRIDVNGDYEPTNCRWADANSQAQNSTQTRWIEFNGERLCLGDWAKKIGLSRSTIRRRLSRGYSLGVVLSPELLPRGSR